MQIRGYAENRWRPQGICLPLWVGVVLSMLIVGSSWGGCNLPSGTQVTVEIEEAGGRDTDDLQVQHFENNNGTFTYTAIPFQIYYKILPDQGWSPDSVQLKIKDASGVIRTQALGTGIGQQDTTWNGKDDSGDYPDYGLDTYKAEIVVTKGEMVCSTEKTFSIYEVRQGNCLYRDCFGGLFEHAAILYEYTGGNNIDDLADEYIVAEHPGSGEYASTNNYADHDTWIGNDGGAYCPDVLKGTQRRAKRKAILEKCHYLISQTLPYIYPEVLLWDDPPGWGGVLSDITHLRCDGFVETAYESVPVQLYGGATWWDVMDGDGTPGTSIYCHNYDYVSRKKLEPERQRHTFDGSGTTNTADDLCKP